MLLVDEWHSEPPRCVVDIDDSIVCLARAQHALPDALLLALACSEWVLPALEGRITHSGLYRRDGCLRKAVVPLDSGSSARTDDRCAECDPVRSHGRTWIHLVC